MSESSITNHSFSPLFANDYHQLPQKLREATGYLATLKGLFAEKAAHDVKWGSPLRALQGLIAGTPEALEAAKENFLLEWRHGDQLDRGMHYWNSPQFRTGDRWICAAMLAQLLIEWDWLAAAGAWSEEEIDIMAAEALDVVEAHLEPHLRGRGRMPIWRETINQNVATACGLLYAGYLFGQKWRNEARAVRMYAYAKNHFADSIGQYPANGYDTDGMTYLRFIHLQCMTLMAALLEDVEGGDWYCRRFQPNNHSLADLNAKQLDLVGPSGWSWPLGRYGYLKSWNLFCQAFASRRTGDPRYLQVAKRDNVYYDYLAPWLGFDLGLGLLWYPQGLNTAITNEDAPITLKNSVVPDSWAAFTAPESRMLCVLYWLSGKAPHFFLEAHGSQLILGGLETWPTANCVQPDGFDWGWQGWLRPGGTLRHAIDIPGLHGAVVDVTANYPEGAHVTHASRSLIEIDANTLLLHDTMATNGLYHPRWQALTLPGTTVTAGTAYVTSETGVTLDLVSATGAFRISEQPQRKLRIDEHAGTIDTIMLELPSDDTNASFDIALSWDQQTQPALTCQRDDLLTLQSAAGETQVLTPGTGMRAIGDYQTDALFATLHGETLALAQVRSVQHAHGECVWTSTPLDVVFGKHAYRVAGMGYGDFIVFHADNQHIIVRRGNGVEIYARVPQAVTLHLQGEYTGCELNGTPASLAYVDGWSTLTIPAVAPDTERLAAQLAAAEGSSALIHALHEIQDAMAWECAPQVRSLLSWDNAVAEMPVRTRSTEATYVRLEAAWALMCLGDRTAIPELITLLRNETARNYDDGSLWAAKWWGFSTRCVVTDALTTLHATELVPLLPDLLANVVVLHDKDALQRAMRILG